jgi:multidrug resistance efflux pump
VATAAISSAGPMLDLVAQVMHEQRFGAATLLLVNGIGAYFGAEQVALGWLQGDAMRAVAISHIDRFEHNTELVQLIEQAFREALGQPGPLWHQADAGSGPGSGVDPLLVAHAQLGRMLKFARLYSLPLADGVGATRAVLLLGFKDALPAPPASADLLLAMSFLQPWLHDLQQRDRWWGARFADWARQRLARLIGPGRVWGRVATLAGSALLLFAIFGSWDYRIEATSQLTTDSMRLVSAQFDGRIEQVLVSAGDVVRQGELMATLDTRELHQQEMDSLAERQRLDAEADKARAVGNLAELGIAQARRAQADAKLTRIVQYLAQARALAPFDGIVVSGERKELLNAPVKKGDNLFRVARIDGLYVEIMVPERDVRYVAPGATGELRLLSHPDQKVRFKMSTMIPIAQVKGQEGNHFLIKARLLQAPEAWWRPGMSGIVLIDGGRQNVTWILTHKLIDTLRMKLWWLA